MESAEFGVLGAEDALRFLDEVSAVLAGSLRYETTLAEIARLAVPALADWCAVDVVEEDGSLRQITSVHPDPEQEELLLELRRRFREQEGSRAGVRGVIATGEPELVADVRSGAVIAMSEEEGAVYERMGPRSYLIVPLVARNRTIGALTFLSTRDGRHYGPGDVSFAMHLARRFALAIDNAGLYDAAERSPRPARHLLRHRAGRARVLRHVAAADADERDARRRWRSGGARGPRDPPARRPRGRPDQRRRADDHRPGRRALPLGDLLHAGARSRRAGDRRGDGRHRRDRPAARPGERARSGAPRDLPERGGGRARPFARRRRDDREPRPRRGAGDGRLVHGRARRRRRTPAPGRRGPPRRGEGPPGSGDPRPLPARPGRAPRLGTRDSDR